MNIGILGTGIVGTTIGSKLAERGHHVVMGSRTRENPKAEAWARAAGPNASHGTFADAAASGEVLFNCTLGIASLEALRLAGRENLAGKVLVDVSNPLDFSHGFPPTLTVCNTDSLGEQLQAAFPELRVVKALNTMTCHVMVDPALVPGEHDVFVSGNDADAKEVVKGGLAEWFGWPQERIIDLGDITTARATEMLLPAWVRLFGAMQHPYFNFHVTIGAPRPQA